MTVTSFENKTYFFLQIGDELNDPVIVDDALVVTNLHHTEIELTETESASARAGNAISQHSTSLLVLDLTCMARLDYTAFSNLSSLERRCHARQINLVFVCGKRSLIEVLKHSYEFLRRCDFDRPSIL